MGKTDIYDQHKAAFAQVEAYAILRDGKRVASIAFKFPKDGAGRLYAYFIDFRRALIEGDNGAGFDRCLRDAGFEVLQAV